MELPAGLKNLGNTCYMNATVQCLKSVPELRDALRDFNDELGAGGSSTSSTSQSITFALKKAYENMDKSNTVTPILLLQTLHIAFPNFAQTGENGVYRQQDANECWSELLKMVQQRLPSRTGTNSSKYNSIIDQYFGGTFNVEMKCTEAPEEESSKSKENFLQLSCFISQEVKYMHSGLRSVM